MKTYKLKKNGVVKVDTNKGNTQLSVLYDADGTFSMALEIYNRYFVWRDLCDSVKRLSTINRKAKEYGVQFEV